MTAGEIIKKLRREKGYTQTELAIMLGLKLSTMQKYESGAILNLKVETIRELCFIFDVPPWLFIFPEQVFVPLHDKIKYTDIFGGGAYDDIFKALMSLNEEGRKKAIDYVNDLQSMEKYKSNITIL